MPGLEALTAGRETIVVLTARDMQSEKVNGLNVGADDYVTKPFSLPELLARINAALRRIRRKLGPSPSVIAYSDVLIDVERRSVTKAGELLDLPQSKVSCLMSGKLSLFSLEHLFAMLNALDRDVEIIIRPKTKQEKFATTQVLLATTS